MDDPISTNTRPSETGHEYETIRLEERGFMTWIVLDRTHAANALSFQLFDELSHALNTLKTSGGRVLGIRGAGRGFSAGYDLGNAVGDESRQADAYTDSERLRSYVDHFLELWDHPKPILVAIHGYCIGGATQLCSYADLAIVAEDATIGESTVPIGGGFVAPVWVPHVGARRAKELAFIPGNRIDGRTAAEWGWANYAVPADQVISATESLAERIARMPSDALRIKKLSINRAAETGPRGASVGIAEMDALAHVAPGIAALREWLAEVGLKAATRAYQTGEGLPETR